MKNINRYLQEIDEYINDKNYDDAFTLCNNVLDNIDSNNIEAIFKAGYCSYKLQKYDIAMMNFTKVLYLEKNPRNKAIYKYYMGRCYDVFHSYKEALECFIDAYNLDSSNKYYTLWLGISYAKKNDYNNALIYLSMSLGSEDYLVYGYLGYCHIKLKNYDTAIMHLEKSISLKDDDYLIRYYAGSTYFLLQVYDKALKHLNESIRLKDDEFDTWFTIGELYQVIEDDSLSKECFEKARNIALEYEDIEKASECFIRLREVQSNEYLNHLYLGICYARLESYKNAVHHLLESIDINEKNNNDNNYLAFYWIGYINYIDSEYDEAIKYLEKSIKLNNDKDNYLNRLWLGNSYFKIGNHKKALFNLNRSIDLKYNEAETYKSIAQLYMSIGQKDKYYEYINIYKKLLKQEKKNKKISNDIEESKNNIIFNDKTIEESMLNNNYNIYYKSSSINNIPFNEIKKEDIEHFINFLFQNIENSDLYNLYSSNIEKKNYVGFDDFNIDNFVSYQNIIENVLKDNFVNDNKITIIKNITPNFYDDNEIKLNEENIKKMICNIENLFSCISDSILNSMRHYYEQYDIELYYILINLIGKYI